jgi:hypothetical protein
MRQVCHAERELDKRKSEVLAHAQTHLKPVYQG